MHDSFYDLNRKIVAEYGSKKFLSERDPFSTGSICVASSVDASGHHSGALVMKDCYKTISIEMTIYEDSELEERLSKIDTMVSELEKFKAVLIEHDEIRRKTEKEHKEHKEKLKQKEQEAKENKEPQHGS